MGSYWKVFWKIVILSIIGILIYIIIWASSNKNDNPILDPVSVRVSLYDKMKELGDRVNPIFTEDPELEEIIQNEAKNLFPCVSNLVNGQCQEGMEETLGCCFFPSRFGETGSEGTEQIKTIATMVAGITASVIIGNVFESAIKKKILRRVISKNINNIRVIPAQRIINKITLDVLKNTTPQNTKAIDQLTKIMAKNDTVYKESQELLINQTDHLIKESTSILTEKTTKEATQKAINSVTDDVIDSGVKAAKEAGEAATEKLTTRLEKLKNYTTDFMNKNTTSKLTNTEIKAAAEEAMEKMIRETDTSAKLIGNLSDEAAELFYENIDDVSKYTDDGLKLAAKQLKNIKYSKAAVKAAAKTAAKTGKAVAKLSTKAIVKGGIIAAKTGVVAAYTGLAAAAAAMGPVGLIILAIELLALAYDIGFGWFHGYSGFISNDEIILPLRDQEVINGQVGVIEIGSEWPLFFPIVMAFNNQYMEALVIAEGEPKNREEAYLAEDTEYIDLILSDDFLISALLMVYDVDYTDEYLDKAGELILNAQLETEMSREEYGDFLFTQLQDLLGDNSGFVQQYPDFLDNENYGISLSEIGVTWWNNLNSDYLLGISTESEPQEYVAYTKEYREIDTNSETLKVISNTLENFAPLVRFGATKIITACYEKRDGKINPYDYGVRYDSDTERCMFTKEFCDRYGMSFLDDGPRTDCFDSAGHEVLEFLTAGVIRDIDRGIDSNERWNAPDPTSCPSGYSKAVDNNCYITCPSTHVKRPNYPGQCAKKCESGTTQIKEDGTQHSDGLYCRIKALDYMTPDVSQGSDKICPVGYNSNPSYPNRCRENKYTEETYLEGKIVSRPSPGYTIGNDGSDIYQYTSVPSNGNCPSNTTKSGNKCKAPIEMRSMGATDKVCPTNYQAPDALGRPDITPAFECYRKSPIDGYDVYVTGDGVGDYMYTSGATNDDNLTMKLGNSVWEVKDQRSSKIDNSNNTKDAKACASNVPYQYDGKCYEVVPGWIPNLALPDCNVGESMKPDIYGNVHKDYSTCEKITL